MHDEIIKALVLDEIKDIMNFIGYNLELVLNLDTVTLYEITKKED